MPEGRIVHSLNDINGSNGYSVRSYQSVWMSHWMRISCNMTTKKHDPPGSSSGNDDFDYNSNVRSGKGLRVVETGTSKTMNDGWTMSTETIGNRELGSFIFKHNQEDSYTMQAIRPVTGHHLEQDQAVGSKRGFSVPSLPCEHDSSADGWYKERSTPFLFGTPSTSDHYCTAFYQDFFHKMQKGLGLCLSPHQRIDSGNTETRKSFYDCYSLNNLQSSHNVERMRICTVMKKGIPKFSETSHRLVMTEKTSVNMFNERDVCNTARVIKSIHENKQKALYSVSSFQNQGKGGLIIQPLSSSTDSEGKENGRDAKISKATINNESSAETDPMNVDFFEPHSGANSTPSEKAIKMDLDFSNKIDVTSKEAQSQRPYNKLPDINLELPALSAEVRSSEDSGPSSSETQPLEMDMLVAHAEQLHKPKSSVFMDNSPCADPSNRWVKRPKLSSSESLAQGPNNSNLAETMSYQKKEKHIGRILANGIPGSEPTPRSGKESMVSDNRTKLLKDNEDFMVDSSNKKTELLLSDAWIRRWIHDGPRICPKNEPIVVSEVQSPNFVLGDPENRQVPSIGAMALMGKAMRGLRPCHPQKQGSFTVFEHKGCLNRFSAMNA